MRRRDVSPPDCADVLHRPGLPAPAPSSGTRLTAAMIAHVILVHYRHPK